jgi:phenylacetate-coenzyme A ligase PaaK-like adenylate-forming protein
MVANVRTLPLPPHPAAHWRRLRDEAARMIDEVPLYQQHAGGAPPPSTDAPEAIAAWLASLPTIAKRDLRRGFPKALVRKRCDLKQAMERGLVEIIATSGTTENRLQVLWETAWWDPQEREAMRLNGTVAAAMCDGFREAVLTTPVCGGSTCHIGTLTQNERTIDGMLFLNQVADPTLWSDAELERMVSEWNELGPHGVEADPQYLAALCRYAVAYAIKLHPPAFSTLTYEQTTRAALRAIKAALPSTPLYQLYGATEAGVLFMECTAGRLHHNARHSHIELVDAGGGLARVVVTTLGRDWMPLLRYDIGDLVRAADSCSCGLSNNGYVLSRVEGRANDAVAAKEGLLTPAMLDDLVDGAEPTIAHWQLQAEPPAGPAGQTGSLGWILHVVGSGGAKAAAALSAALGAAVEPRATTTILAEPSGKYRTVRA